MLLRLLRFAVGMKNGALEAPARGLRRHQLRTRSRRQLPARTSTLTATSPDDLGDAAVMPNSAHETTTAATTLLGSFARQRTEAVCTARMLAVAGQLVADVEVPGRPGDEGESPAFTTKAVLLRYLRRHDAEMQTDPPADRLNKIRRCTQCAAAAELGKPSIDGDQLVLHHDYAFAMQADVQRTRRRCGSDGWCE
jgi:hypothetical protein